MQKITKNGEEVLQMSCSEYAELVDKKSGKQKMTLQAVTKKVREGKLPPGIEAIPFGRFYVIEKKLLNP